MKHHFIPKTHLGQWSIWLITVFIVLFIIIVASGQRGGATFFSNLALSIPMVIAGISALLAFFTGIIGIIKSKERSVLACSSTIVGFFMLLWVSAEILFPH